MRIIKKGATSQSVYFSVPDSTSTTGGKKTGLVFNTSGLTAYYTLNGAAAVAITLATLATAATAWSSGGFVEVSSANAPGLYRLDVPNAGLTGADSVVISLKGATGMVQVDIEIQLSGIDIMDAVRFGITALPNAVAGANGGLPLGDASGRVDLGKILGTAAATPATAGILETNVKNWNNLAAVALPLVPTTAGRTLDVSAGGEAGLDWANVGSPTTVLGLSGTTVKTATDVETKATDIQARLPAALTANGNMKSSMVEILTTALTETAGLLAGGFKKFFNVASPTLTCLGVDQTGDNYTRLGAPAGASHAADTAAVKVDTAAIKAKTDQLAFTVANQVDSNVLTGGGSGLDAAGTRAALGMASANLDTQLAATAQDSTVAKDATVAKAATVATAASIAALNNLSAAQVRTEVKGAIADYGGIL